MDNSAYRFYRKMDPGVNRLFCRASTRSEIAFHAKKESDEGHSKHTIKNKYKTQTLQLIFRGMLCKSGNRKEPGRRWKTNVFIQGCLMQSSGYRAAMPWPGMTERA
jgi:hypothetical protein